MLPSYPLDIPSPINMLLCIRTTIDMPDELLRRVKQIAIQRNTTFRGLVIEALEQSVCSQPAVFRLRDASIPATTPQRLSPSQINQAIDEQRSVPFPR